MLTYIIRRLLLLIPTLLGVLAVVFFVMALAPGGFGGSQLNEFGAQTEGEDAKRIRKQMEQRYGLDQPLIVQFGRWLNQVSPIGFRMSSAITFDEATQAETKAAFEGLAFATRDRPMQQAARLAQSVAAYTAESPVEVASELAASLARPSEAFAWFDRMDTPLAEPLEERLRARIVELEEADRLAQAQREFLNELAFEASGKARIRFDRPALKWPDLGQTLRGRRVIDRLAEAVPITVLLNLITIPVIYLVAIFTGLYAAKNRGNWVDLTTGISLVGLWSIPVIWMGMLLITLLANEQVIKLFPPVGLHDLQADSMPFLPRLGDAEAGTGFQRGYLLDALWHLILPVVCLTYGGFAVMSKVMRGAVLDALSADYVRTARAKGLPSKRVLWGHVFRNSVLPLITMAASILPALFVGSVVVETIFSIPGMGRLGVQAAFEKDRELVLAVTLVAGLLGLLSELLRDICYAVADPRVSYE